MAQMKEEIKTAEKELSDKEISNLSDAKFKTLVIRMFTEMTECPLVNERMKNLMHLHNGILCSRKKEGAPTICDSMDGTGKHAE